MTEQIKTEDEYNLYYDKIYYIVYYKNHPIDIGTDQECKLFHPYKAVFHFGTTLNLYGVKIFKKYKNAVNYCKNKNL